MELRGYKRTHHHNGVPLHVEVSPCSWAYPHYGLQISVRMKDDHQIFLNKKIDFALATQKDVDELVSTISFQKCTQCDEMTFDPATAKTNRNGLCNKCFAADLDLKFAEEIAKEAELESSMKKEGFTHKTLMWVHKKKGDDRQVILYSKGEPTALEIKEELKRLRSIVLDDYQTFKLK